MRSEMVRQFERRFVEGDPIQLFALLFGAVLFVMATQWTGLDARMNDSWYGVAPVRLVGIALLAMGYGAAFSERSRAYQVATAGTLLVAAVATYPLELAAYASSHPATPLWWGFVVPLVDAIAYYGVGVAIGRLSAWLRLRSILPLTVPSVLVGVIWLDVRVGAGLVNPLTTATVVAPAHLALATAAALATALALLRPVAAPREAQTS